MDALSFALACPKAELHMHIEGSLEPELAFELAQRNGIALPYANAAELRAAYDFEDLQSFLDLYYACAQVLITERDFHDLMFAYLQRAHADGIVRAEVFFDPQTHTERGIDIKTVIDGLWSGAQEAERRFGISTALILCFLRHLPEQAAFDTLQQAEPYLDRIVGFGLDSSEKGHPPSKFERVFARCRELGKYVVAHAGEEGPPAYITEALDLLKADRIDHGVRSVEDAAVLERVARERIPLTVCPLSNVRLCVFDKMELHTLPQLLAAGANVTLNCDDPAYFGGYLGDNIRAVQAAFDWDIATWYSLARNSLESTFASPAQKASWVARLDAMLHAAS
ncbi:adenosine deaminase [Uliginosibacterium sp. sgz301328]|uniref:adenosine deaminase n=1 Tax=Uliginosibacterium sp. sgz301328 TaxID=3243764 RepID=UPI00359D385D